MAEPDTLVYVIHVVPKAPMQRIIYEIYRDRAAFEEHERQPHMQRFAADRQSCVLATNVIDLRLKYAKVAALGAPEVPPFPPAPPPGQTQMDRAPRAAQNGQYPGDRYPAGNGQYPAPGNGQYPAPGNGQYSNGQQYGNGQYGGGQYPDQQGGYPDQNGSRSGRYGGS